MTRLFGTFVVAAFAMTASAAVGLAAEVTLAWDASPSPPSIVQGYRVETVWRQAPATNWPPNLPAVPKVTGIVTNLTATITNLLYGETYEFRVYAVHVLEDTGEWVHSDPSNTVIHKTDVMLEVTTAVIRIGMAGEPATVLTNYTYRVKATEAQAFFGAKVEVEEVKQ